MFVNNAPKPQVPTLLLQMSLAVTPQLASWLCRLKELTINSVRQSSETAKTDDAIRQAGALPPCEDYLGWIKEPLKRTRKSQLILLEREVERGGE